MTVERLLHYMPQKRRIMSAVFEEGMRDDARQLLADFVPPLRRDA